MRTTHFLYFNLRENVVICVIWLVLLCNKEKPFSCLSFYLGSVTINWQRNSKHRNIFGDNLRLNMRKHVHISQTYGGCTVSGKTVAAKMQIFALN